MGGESYLQFLVGMRDRIRDVTTDFKRLGLPDTPSEYLSAQLGYGCTRPLTKCLDDYNWVTITKKWPPQPPKWLITLVRDSE